MAMKIGVVGLGVMGGAFSGHLLDAGFEVAGYDPVEKMHEKFKGKNLRRAKSPADAAEGSELIMTSLPNHKFVEEAISGPEGVFEGTGSGAVIADMSTVPPELQPFFGTVCGGKGPFFSRYPSQRGGETGTSQGSCCDELRAEGGV